ncbi:hypothetical protein ACI2K4_21915 [Micromonospora sp. NPDC050397]|uniref:hypothetical protein n=1 Tax=Micromonospora sp. NPDC050397 TaxID=3364279 RepID=UPI00385021E3
MAEYLRIRARRLQTPIAQFIDPSNLRRVTLVGTAPIGEARYYAALLADIAKLHQEGAVVHREGNGVRAHPTDAAATPAEQEVLDQLDAVRVLVGRRAAECGWIRESDGLPDDSWQNHDLSELEILRLMGIDDVRDRARVTHRRLDWPDGHYLPAVKFRRETVTAFRAAASNRATIQREIANTLHPVIDHRRNDTALVHLYGTERDVVLVWGTRHLLPIATDLCARGYMRVDITWQTVGRLPGLAFEVARILNDLVLPRLKLATRVARWRRLQGR